MQPAIITIQKIRRPLSGIYSPVYDSVVGLPVMLAVGEGGAQTVDAEAARYVRVYLANTYWT